MAQPCPPNTQDPVVDEEDVVPDEEEEDDDPDEEEEELVEETLTRLLMGMVALPICTSMSLVPVWIPVMVPVTVKDTSDVFPDESMVLTATL